jgi:hypothetical protein
MFSNVLQVPRPQSSPDKTILPNEDRQGSASANELNPHVGEGKRKGGSAPGPGVGAFRCSQRKSPALAFGQGHRWKEPRKGCGVPGQNLSRASSLVYGGSLREAPGRLWIVVPHRGYQVRTLGFGGRLPSRPYSWRRLMSGLGMSGSGWTALPPSLPASAKAARKIFFLALYF